MRFAISAIAFAASLVVVGAQDLQGIPTCAFSCFASAVPDSGCSLEDRQCQCTTGRDSITESLTSCVPGKCSAEEIESIAPAVEGICSSAGITMSADNSTSSGSNMTSSASPTADSPAEQTENAAVANVAGMGAVALGFAAMWF